jgi:hypothetical protein
VNSDEHAGSSEPQARRLGISPGFETIKRLTFRAIVGECDGDRYRAAMASAMPNEPRLRMSCGRSRIFWGRMTHYSCTRKRRKL